MEWVDSDRPDFSVLPVHRRSGHAIFLKLAAEARGSAARAFAACAPAGSGIVCPGLIPEWVPQSLPAEFMASVRRAAADRDLLCDHRRAGAVVKAARLDRGCRRLPGGLLD